jgi:hypothetical protein
MIRTGKRKTPFVLGLAPTNNAPKHEEAFPATAEGFFFWARFRRSATRPALVFNLSPLIIQLD